MKLQSEFLLQASLTLGKDNCHPPLFVECSFITFIRGQNIKVKDAMEKLLELKLRVVYQDLVKNEAIILAGNGVDFRNGVYKMQLFKNRRTN